MHPDLHAHVALPAKHRVAARRHPPPSFPRLHDVAQSWPVLTYSAVPRPFVVSRFLLFRGCFSEPAVTCAVISVEQSPQSGIPGSEGVCPFNTHSWQLSPPAKSPQFTPRQCGGPCQPCLGSKSGCRRRLEWRLPVSRSGEVVCEPPNNKLDRFSGTLYWKESKFPLSNQNTLLRGCVLRNTEWCFGLVVFAGEPPPPGTREGVGWPECAVPSEPAFSSSTSPPPRRPAETRQSASVAPPPPPLPF